MERPPEYSAIVLSSPNILRRILSIALLSATSASVAQEKPARLTYEVASIRPSASGERGGGIKPIPGGEAYTAKNVPVKLIIALMYKLPMRQVTGGPSWLESDHFDIDAKADHSYSKDDLQEMFRNLLADRFNLKFHIETKEDNIYALTVDKSGAKMKPNPKPDPANIPINFNGWGAITAKGADMKYFAWFLGQGFQEENRAVLNLTNLPGFYDFTLTWRPDILPGAKEELPAEMLDRPSIFDAVREQLGLKLTAQRGPVDFLVIDHIDKPSAN